MHFVNIHLSYLAISTVHIITQRLSISWQWYIVRAAGFTAAGLLILLMLSGIGQVTGYTYRYIEPIKAWAIHKALAIALIISILIHVGFLLAGNLVKFTLPEVTIPFLSNLNNGTKLLGLSLGWAAIAFGIIAMYGIFIIVISSLGIIHTKKKAWKRMHFLSYLVAVLVFFHALYTGSDLKYGVFRAFWIFLGIIVLVGILIRLRRVGTIKNKDKK